MMPRDPNRGRGIHVQSAMGWLLDTLILNKPLTRPPMPESLDPTNFWGGTFNMNLLFSVCWWVYETLSQDKKADIGRQRLINYMKIDAACHQDGEPTTPSHEQLYLGGWGAILLNAWRANDREILDYATKWFRVGYAIYRVCEVELTPEEVEIAKKKRSMSPSEVWTCGGRVYKGKGESRKIIGISPARGKFLVAVRGQKLSGKPTQDYLGPWCIEQLWDEGFPVESLEEWPKEFPPMWTAFHAERFAGGQFYMLYNGPTWKDCALSAGFDGERWISLEVDHDRILATRSKFGAPVLVIDAPESPMRKIEEGRKKNK